jgi:phosphohistidine phosphatase
MKQLLLLRHAKSSWADDALADRQRPLAARGAQAATRMGEELAARGLLPDRILCSPAVRTRETLAQLKPSLAAATPVEFVEDLYDPPEADYLGIIHDYGGSADRLLVIGHNPHTHATALTLVGDGDRGERARLVVKFPTAGLAVLAFDDNSWAGIAPASGRLEAFVRPKDLMPDADDD